MNLADALGAWADPIGLDVGDLSDQAAVAEEQEVSTGTFGAMAARFDGAAGAFAYLLFILLYAPCTAAIAAIYQESGARWAAFVTAWTTGLGWGVATVYYQAATWAQHPGSSFGWIAAVGDVSGKGLAAALYMSQATALLTASGVSLTSSTWSTGVLTSAKLDAVGVLIIQALTTSILMSGLPPEYNKLVKAIVILVVLLLQAPKFRTAVTALFRTGKGKAKS